jgi:hypothetical protein
LENEGIRLLQTVESHWDAVVEYLG